MHIRLKLIQVIRGIAAMIVILVHVSSSTLVYFKTPWLNDIFKVGWNGVDIFFVLSGFIITFIHFGDLVKRQNVKQFFIKRFNRIYPIFWVVNTVAVGLLVATKKYTMHNVFSLFTLKSYLLLSTDVPLLPLRVAWSLCYEVLFYLVFGVCIVMGFRLSKWVWVAWLALIVAYYLLVDKISPPVVLNPFILEFLMGCVVGYIFKAVTVDNSKFTLFQNNTKALIGIGIVLFIAMWSVSYLTDYGQKNAIESRIFYGLSASLIILGAAIIDYRKSVKVPGWLLLIGDASYVIYLTHFLILASIYKTASSVLKHHNSSVSVLVVGLVAFGVAIGCGVLFHIFIEKPLLKKVNSLTLKKA
ncbi:MAG TPA: acyltransferase [Bacteroidia bacterium]|jgi:exopolysaccharide production protein ExoZ|nr:acyltransferase [Bacteroidia bacterium]